MRNCRTLTSCMYTCLGDSENEGYLPYFGVLIIRILLFRVLY